MSSTSIVISQHKACFALIQAKQKISDRGKLIGIDQADDVEALRTMVPHWDEVLAAVQDKSLVYPEYYTQPFHAYTDGNLCWEAAFQVPPAAAVQSKLRSIFIRA